MQFALHYLFETEARAEMLFDDVGAALKSGGAFVATTVDARALARLARTRGVRAAAADAPDPSVDDWYAAERDILPVGLGFATHFKMTTPAFQRCKNEQQRCSRG